MTVQQARQPPEPPPHSVEAEQQLLGAILYNNAVTGAVCHLIEPEHFHQPVHGRVYQTMREMLTRGEDITPFSVARYMAEDAALKDLGEGRAEGYLVALSSRNINVASSADHARIIRDLWLRRRIMGACDAVAADAVTIAPERMADVIAADAIDRLNGIAAGVAVEALRPLDGEDARAIYEGRLPIGPSTGLRDLDGRIKGLAPGRLVILAGRPGMGKSALAGTLADTVATAGHGVVAFSLEMGRGEITLRAMSREMRRRGEHIPYDWLMDPKSVQPEWIPALDDAGGRFGDLPLLIDDRSALTAGQIEAGVVAGRARLRQMGHELALVVVDHIGIMRGDGRSDRNRVEVLGEITSRLKAIAKRYECCVLALCQLSRGVERRDDKRPHLDDLRASGEIEENADAVLMLYREAYYKSRQRPREGASQAESAAWQADLAEIANQAEIIVEKNRMGSTGAVTAYCDIACDFFGDLHHG